MWFCVHSYGSFGFWVMHVTPSQFSIAFCLHQQGSGTNSGPENLAQVFMWRGRRRKKLCWGKIVDDSKKQQQRSKSRIYAYRHTPIHSSEYCFPLIQTPILVYLTDDHMYPFLVSKSHSIHHSSRFTLFASHDRYIVTFFCWENPFFRLWNKFPM